MKLIFYMQMIVWSLMGMVNHSLTSQNNKFAMSSQYRKKKKKMRYGVDFLHEDKHQSFLKVDLNTLGIKGDSTIIEGYDQAFSKYLSNKSAISHKEVRYWVHFLHADKHHRFYKFALLFWWKWPDMSKVPKKEAGNTFGIL